MSVSMRVCASAAGPSPGETPGFAPPPHDEFAFIEHLVNRHASQTSDPSKLRKLPPPNRGKTPALRRTEDVRNVAERFRAPRQPLAARRTRRPSSFRNRRCRGPERTLRAPAVRPSRSRSGFHPRLLRLLRDAFWRVALSRTDSSFEAISVPRTGWRFRRAGYPLPSHDSGVGPAMRRIHRQDVGASDGRAPSHAHGGWQGSRVPSREGPVGATTRAARAGYAGV
jgi:hypothetical protein